MHDCTERPSIVSGSHNGRDDDARLLWAIQRRIDTHCAERSTHYFDHPHAREHKDDSKGCVYHWPVLNCAK
jgi:hypothetical protein